MKAMVFPLFAMVKRELLTTLRGTRAFVVVSVFVGIATLYALVTWPPDQTNFTGAGIASRTLVNVLFVFLFTGCILFVPAHAASAIVSERQRETYDFLFTSLVRPSGVVFAKLVNAVGFFFVVLVAITPVLSVSFFLVGIDPVEAAWMLGLVVATSISCASVGLYSSARFRTGMGAIGGAYLGVLVLMAGPLILAYIAYGILYQFYSVRSFIGNLEVVLYTFSPVGTLVGIFDGRIDGQTYVYGIGYQLAFTSVCLLLTYLQVRRPPLTVNVTYEKPIDDAKVLQRRRNQFPFYLIDPLKRKKPIEDGRNPMMVRELRWGLLNRGTVLVRIFYIAFTLYFFMGAIASMDARSYDTMGNWLLIQIVATLIAAPALMANALTKETELGNMDMLRMTLLRPRDIILGKMFAGVGSILPMIAAAVLSCVPVIAMGARNWTMLFMGYTTLFVCAIVSLSIGLLASMLTKRTSASLITSYLMGIMVFGGIAFLAEWIGRRNRGYYSSGGEFLSPYTAFLSPVTAFVRSADFNDYRNVDVDMTYWAASMVASIVFSCTVVAASVAGFARYRMVDR